MSVKRALDINKPFQKLGKGTGESAAHSESLGNSRDRGIPSVSVINVWLASRSHFRANSSSFRFVCTFEELRYTFLVSVSSK